MFYKNDITEEALEVDGLQLAPNPALDQVQVTIPGTLVEGELMLINALGAVVYSKTNLNGEAVQLQVDLSTLPAGPYFVRVQNGADVMIERLIRQ